MEAISSPRTIVPHCARAIDTLRVLSAPAKANKKRGWEILQRNLQVSEEYVKLLSVETRASRRGDHQAVSGEMTSEISKRAWTIMNRYLEYRKRGDQPLPLDLFPPLTG